MANLDALWRPLKVGSVELKHRIFVSAHTQGFGENHLLSDRHVAYYAERAKGGAALVITEQQGVHWTAKGSYHVMVEGWREEAIPQYRNLADAVHAHGGRVFVQGFGCGQQDDGVMFLDNRHELRGPSAIPSVTYRTHVREMDRQDIGEIVEGYAKTAHNAQVAGIDGFEIHGAHGYLLCQFLSPLTNHRSDRYGGSTENRCRIAIEAIEAIKQRCGGGFTVGIRLSFDEFVEGGITPDEGERIVAVLKRTGLFDYFNTSGGNYHTMHQAVAPMNVEHGFMVGFAGRVKQIVGDTPVFTVARIVTIEEAAAIVAGGHADMVAMTRAHIADPEIVNKVRSGRGQEVRRCIGANQGCINRLFQNTMISCTQNPAVGLEREWGMGTLTPAAVAKKVVVVGGGPAGMKAAEIAARRGHRVTLFERENRLGGQIPYSAMLPTGAEWDAVTEYLEGAIARLGVDVRLGAEATPVLVRAEAPDEVVLATGATYDKSGYNIFRGERPAIPGLDRENVLDPVEALANPDRCGLHVLILDEIGDYQALGVAEFLADRGKQVEIVTRHMFVGDRTATTLDLVHV